MIRKPVMSGVLLATLLGIAGPLAVTPAAPAFAADKDSKSVRPEVGKPVQAAQDLLKAGKNKEALAKLQEADAAKDKTAYESYAIAATRTSAYLKLEDYPNAIKGLEAELASGFAPDSVSLEKALSQLSYQTKDYAKAIDYANRFYRDGGTDDSLHLLVAQAYYVQQDYPNAVKALRPMVQANEKAGKKTDENLLLMLMDSEYKQKDDAGYLDVLEKLVANYPKDSYWSDLLLAVQRKKGFADRLALDVDRLAIAVGTMKQTSEYMEAAQLALQAGLPGDAKTILNKGYAAGLLGKGGEADRQKRLNDMANHSAGEDQKTLAQTAKEAETAPNGLALVKLGEAYASYGQYDKAIDALQRGIQKGGLKYPNDAKLHLGIAYLQAGQKAKAHEVFKSINGQDGTQDLAQLWILQSGA